MFTGKFVIFLFLNENFMARNLYVSAHSTLYGTVTVSLRSGDGQVTFKSRSDRGKARVQSRSAHDQHSLLESI